MRCSVNGCENEVYCKGWCQKHYNCWYHNGDVNFIKKIKSLDYVPRDSKLIFIRDVGTKRCGKKMYRYAIYECECGNKIERQVCAIHSGNTKSCGCLKDGHSNHFLYPILVAMKSRCYNKNHKAYKNYGGRGIMVCDEWKNSAKTFIEWALPLWKKGLQIDRQDNDGNYEPENCRFVNSKINNRNRRNNHILKFDDKEQSISAWSEETNIKVNTLCERIKRGWPTERVLTKRIGV